MSPDVPALYHAAITKTCESADPEMETLRKSIVRGELRSIDVNPAAIANAFSKPEEWGLHAFSDLRRAGFVTTLITSLDWYQPNWGELTDDLAVLAGVESTAIIRLSALDCSAALQEVSRRLADLSTSAATGNNIAFLLAYQRLMLAVVAASNEEELFREYAGRATVATVYARAAFDKVLEPSELHGAAEKMVELLCSPSSRQCAALAADMRLQSPIAAAA